MRKNIVLRVVRSALKKLFKWLCFGAQATRIQVVYRVFFKLLCYLYFNYKETKIFHKNSFNKSIKVRVKKVWSRKIFHTSPVSSIINVKHHKISLIQSTALPVNWSKLKESFICSFSQSRLFLRRKWACQLIRINKINWINWVE